MTTRMTTEDAARADRSVTAAGWSDSDHTSIASQIRADWLRARDNEMKLAFRILGADVEYVARVGAGYISSSSNTRHPQTTTQLLEARRFISREEALAWIESTTLVNVSIQAFAQVEVLS